MKPILHSILTGICIFALSGCAQFAAFQANPTVQTIETVALEAAGAYFGVPPGATSALIAGAEHLYGVAAQAQANVGKTPQAANVAQGAGIAGIGQAVQALSTAPITQSYVNTLYAAAGQLAAKANSATP